MAGAEEIIAIFVILGLVVTIIAGIVLFIMSLVKQKILSKVFSNFWDSFKMNYLTSLGYLFLMYLGIVLLMVVPIIVIYGSAMNLVTFGSVPIIISFLFYILAIILASTYYSISIFKGFILNKKFKFVWASGMEFLRFLLLIIVSFILIMLSLLLLGLPLFVLIPFINFYGYYILKGHDLSKSYDLSSKLFQKAYFDYLACFSVLSILIGALAGILSGIAFLFQMSMFALGTSTFLIILGVIVRMIPDVIAAPFSYMIQAEIIRESEKLK